MNDEFGNSSCRHQMTAKNKRFPVRRILRPFLIFFVLLVLLILCLPGLLTLAVNRVLLPQWIADPEIPLVSGLVENLTYTGARAVGLRVDAGGGLALHIPSAEAAYSPGQLVKRRISSVHATVQSGPPLAFTAEVQARRIYMGPDRRIDGEIDAACSRISSGAFSVGPFDAHAVLDGTNAQFSAEIPLQDGLLEASVRGGAGWQDDLVNWNGSVDVPLGGKESSPLDLSSLVPGLTNVAVDGRLGATVRGGKTSAEAAVSLVIHDLAIPNYSLEMNGLEATLRMGLSDPVEGELQAACSGIRSGAFSAGPVAARAVLTGTNAQFSAEIPLQDRQLLASVKGAAGWRDGALHWNGRVDVPLGGKDAVPLDLSGLVPGLTEVAVDGQLEAVVRGGKAGTEAAVSLGLRNLEIPSSKLQVAGLETLCRMELSGKPRSLPEQELSIKTLTAGNFQVEQLLMHYQLENGPAFYIENVEFTWCGGRVSLYDTRLRPALTNLAVRLFCDRLSLQQVLSACGVESFSGDGELNGRLPVQWTAADGIRIDRGFLYTTPGKSGVFSLGDSSSVAGSLLPPGTVEAGQVGLISDALSAFRYDWITMTLNTEEDNLKIVVDMAGTPVNVLSYEYDSKRGTYMKIAPRPGRGIRQPMQFKLNLSVPLNQLVCYASGINRQWNLFKSR
jgi:hypothetical protein